VKESLKRSVTITTIDNPYDPFDDFEHWFQFDTEKGYYTSSRVARLTKLRDDMSEVEEDLEVERAIDRLIEIDPLKIYKKVVRERDEDKGGGVV
jgi:hypothetical protein